MKPHEFRAARLAKGWTQTQAAVRLGMTPAYLNFLEPGKRRLTPELVRRATSVYELSPDVLPFANPFTPTQTDDQRLTEFLSMLGYPGFSYLRTHTPKKHPYEVLLSALAQQTLEGRVAEALPWIVLKYAQPNSWLVENARRFNLQNRLGFVVTLARRLSELRNLNNRSTELNKLENLLGTSPLPKQDLFYPPPRPHTEQYCLRLIPT